MLLGSENNEFLGMGLPFFGYANIDNSQKQSHDEYRVFVNNAYVGQKVLLSEKEKPEDLDKYLYSQGFENFETEVNGGNLIIHCNDEVDNFESIINSYLNNK